MTSHEKLEQSKINLSMAKDCRDDGGMNKHDRKIIDNVIRDSGKVCDRTQDSLVRIYNQGTK